MTLEPAVNGAPDLPPVVEPRQLAEILRSHPEIRLFDVRTPGEYDSTHIPGAYNVPLDTLDEHAPEIRASVGEPIVLICQSGNRARRAEETLARAGLPSLHVLDGGIAAWTTAELPVRRGRHRLSLERQVRIGAGAIAAIGGLLALVFDPLFGALSAAVGLGLVTAGLTDTCLMGMLLARLPYNRTNACDIDAVVRALAAGGPR